MTTSSFESWPKLQLRHVFNVIMGATPDSGEAEYWDGDIYWVTPEDIGKLSGNRVNGTRRRLSEAGYRSCGTQIVKAGAIVVTKRAPIGETAILAVDAACNQGCFLLDRKHSSTDTRFYYYVFVSSAKWLNILGRGSTFVELSTDDLKALQMPRPEPTEQKAIADYLDRETERIDALIAEKERWLELLAEKRQALITHAVTRGLNPDAPMKDSGVPWLGQVPEHWEIDRLKFRLYGIEQGWSPLCFEVPAEEDQFGVLKTGCVNGGRFREEQNKVLPPENAIPYELEIHPGDVLMSRASGSLDLIGSVALVEKKPKARLLLSDKIYRLNTHINTSPGFLVFALNSDIGRTQTRLVVSGAEGLANNIAIGDVKNYWLAFPDLEEQRVILLYIQQETGKIDALITATEQTIALLKERRAALIAAAVTGQLVITNGGHHAN